MNTLEYLKAREKKVTLMLKRVYKTKVVPSIIQAYAEKLAEEYYIDDAVDILTMKYPAVSFKASDSNKMCQVCGGSMLRKGHKRMYCGDMCADVAENRSKRIKRLSTK